MRFPAADRSERLVASGSEFDDDVEAFPLRIEARDGAAIRDKSVIRVKALDDAEIVLVDSA